MKLSELITQKATINYSVDDDYLGGDKPLTNEIQAALVNAGYTLEIDGLFGRLTREALNDFKEANHLGFPDQLGSYTAEKLLEYLNKPPDFKYCFPPIKIGSRDFIVSVPTGFEQRALSSADYSAIANSFNLEPPLIRAVVEVESAGSGFLLGEKAPSRPKILFEAHLFHKFTGGKYQKYRRDLSSPYWNPSLYKGGSAEWNRLLAAMEFDAIAALKSASYGLGQVVGMNYKVADGDDSIFTRFGQNYTFYGYNDVIEMVTECHISEFHQLTQMVNFIKNNNLLDDLRRKDWHSFARGYNGPAYAKNNYHVKLDNSYKKWLRLL